VTVSVRRSGVTLHKNTKNTNKYNLKHVQRLCSIIIAKISKCLLVSLQECISTSKLYASNRVESDEL